MTPLLPWLHTGLILAGFWSLMLAVGAAALYLLQSAALKSKHPGTIFFRRPSLEGLDRIHFWSLTSGFVFFTLGILSGLFWAKTQARLGSLPKDPRVLLSFLTCLLYGTVLAARLSAIRRGQKIAAGTLVIFLFFLAAVFISHGMN